MVGTNLLQKMGVKNLKQYFDLVAKAHFANEQQNAINMLEACTVPQLAEFIEHCMKENLSFTIMRYALAELKSR